MSTLRLVGDLHGDPNAINALIQSCHRYDLTIQVGDYGIGFGAERSLDSAPENLKILHGNHDNYDLLSQYPNDLGRFGVYEFAGRRIFYIAGAWSLDSSHRTEGIDWWSNEELSKIESELCLELWKLVCHDIDIVITHDCPPIVSAQIGKENTYVATTRTGALLNEVFATHSPPMWFFGHWHVNFSKRINGTDFRCLNINEKLVLEF